MATNPMQRKARNSFLLGMLLMLVITGLIIAFLAMMLMQANQKLADTEESRVKVYVLNTNVRSGDVITNDMYSLMEINSAVVPSNATSTADLFTDYALQDKDGNQITTKTEEDEDTGEMVNKNYITIDGREYEVFKDELHPENRYIERDGENEYLDLVSVPLIAKVDMNANTVLTLELLEKGDNTVQDDVRRQEYNVVVLPLDLTTGDYIDIRLMLPNGQDFIVVSKKEVEIPIVGDTDSQTTMWVDLSEDEILHMSCAIVDAARVTGAKLYATKYTDPGMQRAATPTYAVNSETSALLTNNPNILESAMTELTNRYSQGNSANLRNEYIQPEIDSQGEQGQSNLETQMQDSITRSQEERVDYLEGLASSATTTTTTTSGSTTTNTTTNTAQ